jgi:hypothetical protein
MRNKKEMERNSAIRVLKMKGIDEINKNLYIY